MALAICWVNLNRKGKGFYNLSGLGERVRRDKKREVEREKRERGRVREKKGERERERERGNFVIASRRSNKLQGKIKLLKRREGNFK